MVQPPFDALEVIGPVRIGGRVRVLEISAATSGFPLATIERAGRRLPYDLALNALAPDTPEAAAALRAYEEAEREEVRLAEEARLAAPVDKSAARAAHRAASRTADAALRAVPRLKLGEAHP